MADVLLPPEVVCDVEEEVGGGDVAKCSYNTSG